MGVPTVSKMRLSWSDSFLPGKAEDLVKSSATMQPTDHKSTAGPYCRRSMQAVWQRWGGTNVGGETLRFPKAPTFSRRVTCDRSPLW